MEWQGGNKQRPNYWQWRRSFILGDSNWKSFQVGYPVDMYFSPKWMLSRVRSVKLFFLSFFFFFFFLFFWGGGRGGGECFEQSTSWCFGSHFFVARSHRFIAICHCRFLASLKNIYKKLRKSMERKLLCQPFTATNCSTLARHTLKLICQTTFDSVLFKSLLSHAGQLSCCDVTEVTWPKRGILSCRRRRCTKRRVCFHSNQYFYVPQENVNLSNEQRVC